MVEPGNEASLLCRVYAISGLDSKISPLTLKMMSKSKHYSDSIIASSAGCQAGQLGANLRVCITAVICDM